MAALATLFDSRLSLWAKAHGQPPTFAAYQEFIQGLDRMVQFDSRGAIVHFRRAAQEDTTFRLPLIFAAHEHMDLGEFATADSIAQAVERAPGRLSPLDEHYLRWVLAQVRGDRQHALETAREMVTIAPNSETLWLVRRGRQGLRGRMDARWSRADLLERAPVLRSLSPGGGREPARRAAIDRRVRPLPRLGVRGRPIVCLFARRAWWTRRAFRHSRAGLPPTSP